MSRNSLLLTTTLAAAFLLYSDVTAGATVVDVHHLNIKLVNQKLKAAVPAATVLQQHARMLPLESESSLTLIENSKARVGRFYRYQQTFRGAPIFGKQIVVSEDPSGNVRNLSGNMLLDLSDELPKTSVRLSRLQALNIAKRGSLGDRWATLKTELDSAQLMIYIDKNKHARMAYVVSFFADMPRGLESIQPLIIVDAYTGRIIDQWEQSANSLIGTGPGGNAKTGAYEFGTDFGFLDVAKSGTTCTMKNNSVRTLNFNNLKTGGALHTYTCPRNVVRPANGAFSPLNDAHYFGTVTYYMYRNYLGMAPVPFQINVRAHYDVNYANAKWVPANMAINLGDGLAASSYPWASLDIVSHEIGHAFTDQHGKLLRAKKTGPWPQSAAIDEAFGDMAGEAAEFFTTGTNDFMFGAQIVKGNGAIRYMGNPPQDGHSKDHASAWTNMLDAHYSAGIYNKAFYLLAHMPSWDTKKAFQAFALANIEHWTPDITFNQGACGVELAAQDLGYPAADVTSAFSAVGVSCGLIWDSSTALALYDGPSPIFSDAHKTIASGVEPANGEYGFATRASIYKNSGKRYAEFTFLTQTAATQFGYSGQVCLSLRDQSIAVQGNAGMLGDWALCWLTDSDHSPTAVAPPWFRSNAILWGPAGNQGPLNAWRITQGDTIGVAADLDSGKLWFSLNGVWVGNPADGTGAAFDQSLYGADKYIAGKQVTPHLYSDFLNIKTRIRGNTGETIYAIPTGFVGWGD